MEINDKAERIIFAVVKEKVADEDFKDFFNQLKCMNDLLFKEAILEMIPGKLKLRRFKFLTDVPSQDFKLILNEYYEDMLADEKLRQIRRLR